MVRVLPVHGRPASRWLGLVCAALAGACGSGEAPPSPAAPRALSGATMAPVEVPPATRDEATMEEPAPVLWVGGDVLVSDAMEDFARLDDDPAVGFARALEPVARLWREPGAFPLVNLEMPVAETRRHALDEEPTNPHGLTAVHLHGPRWLPEALARAGVRGVTLANNHALDQDRDGLLETIAAARRAGLVVSGAGVYPRQRWPITLGSDGRELCVMSFYDARGPGAHEPGEVARSVLDDDGVEQVRVAAARCAAVVAVVHVLGELVAEPKPAWRRWARRLVDAGAKAIVVHGTHVVLPVERLDGVPVVWGLGNLVSDMGRLARPGLHEAEPPKERAPATREALIARLVLGADGALDLRLIGTWMSNDRVPRWRHRLPGGDVIRFALRPMGACRPAVRLEGWPRPERAATERWITTRRDHLLRVTALRMDPCAPGGVSWLRLSEPASASP